MIFELFWLHCSSVHYLEKLYYANMKLVYQLNVIHFVFC